MQPIDPAHKPACTSRRSTTSACGSTTCRAAVAWLTAQGVRFTPGGIRKGAAGHDITFIHPKGNDDVSHRRRGRADRAGAGAAGRDRRRPLAARSADPALPLHRKGPRLRAVSYNADLAERATAPHGQVGFAVVTSRRFLVHALLPQGPDPHSAADPATRWARSRIIIVFHVMRWRRDYAEADVARAFPEKSAAERTARSFATAIAIWPTR